MNTIKCPEKCTDAELDSILARAQAHGYEFPYFHAEKRYLKIEDYMSERFLRDNKSAVKSEKKNQELDILLKMLNSYDPNLYILFSDAIRSCRETKQPIELNFREYTANGRYLALQLLAAGSFRTAMRRYARCTIVGTDFEKVWLLPTEISVHEWILDHDGFVKVSRLKSNYPRAFSVFERLAEATHGSDERCASVQIDDSENLWQVINILAVYPRYYPIEELFRVEFAYGTDNRVMTRTLVVNPPEFIAFTSPAQSFQSRSL